MIIFYRWFALFFFFVEQSSLISYDTLWEQVNPQEKQFFKTLEEDLDKIEKFYESNINNNLFYDDFLIWNLTNIIIVLIVKLRESLNRFDELVEQYKFMKESRIKKRVS